MARIIKTPKRYKSIKELSSEVLGHLLTKKTHTLKGLYTLDRKMKLTPAAFWLAHDALNQDIKELESEIDLRLKLS